MGCSDRMAPLNARRNISFFGITTSVRTRRLTRTIQVWQQTEAAFGLTNVTSTTSWLSIPSTINRADRRLPHSVNGNHCGFDGEIVMVKAISSE